MSVKIMAEVWELDVPQNRKLVLLAFADHADDAGVCFPGVARVAWKTGFSVRQIRRVTGELRKAGLLGEISSSDGGRGKTRVYRIQPEKGVKLTPFSWGKDDIQSPERVTSSAQKGDTAMSEKGDIAVSPESSLTTNEPSNPSVQRSERSGLAIPGGNGSGNRLFGKIRVFAERTWTERFGSMPTWMRKDFIGLSRTLRRHRGLTLEEFADRWGRYLQDSDAFVARQGYSLAYFCSRFDAYIKRPAFDIPLATPYED